MAANNGSGAHQIDHGALRGGASEIAVVAQTIAQIADEVSAGAESQIRSLDGALGGVNLLAASLKETATQADSVSGSTEELVSSVNEVAASIEQITGGADSLATAIREVASSMQESKASIQRHEHGAGNGDHGTAGHHLDRGDGHLGQRRGRRHRRTRVLCQ